MLDNDKIVGLYVHIPFCAAKCPYCDFYSVKYSTSLEHAYIEVVVQEIYRYSGRGYRADTLYFGGGTPSIVTPRSIARVIAAAVEVFSLVGEVTLEANPNTLTHRRLAEYAAIGINRISMGMQSAQAAELSALGRTHTTSQVITAVNEAVSVGISNISLDLMLGTPHQTLDSLNHTLRVIGTLPITHVSAYMLQIEEGTVFYSSNIREQCASDDEVADLYLGAIAGLNAIGLEQYEISSFAKDGAKSRHNMKYWQLSEYIGIGASAHSYFEGTRFFHGNDIDVYIMEKGVNTIITDTSCGGVDEYIMLGLRLSEGIRLEVLEANYGISVQMLDKTLARYLQNDYIMLDGGTISLTNKGKLLSNAVIGGIISVILP